MRTAAVSKTSRSSNEQPPVLEICDEAANSSTLRLVFDTAAVRSRITFHAIRNT